jgi:hypothetical protein
MDSKLLEAKELALKLRAKAELLDSLDANQLEELKTRVSAETPAVVSSCWISSPCALSSCIVNSPA